MKLVLLGAGGHAGDVLGLIEDLRRLTGFDIEKLVVSDDWLARKDRFLNRQVELVQGEEKALKGASHFIAAKGYPEARRETALRALKHAVRPCVPLRHPLGNLNQNVIVGVGTVILALCSMSPGVKIGNHCYISHGVLIGHDTQVGDFTSIMPGASISGDVTLGEDVLIGAGAIVLEKITIGRGAKVGAGAVVVKNVGEGETVMGVPARSRQV